MTSRSLFAGIHRILAKIRQNAQPRSSPIHRYPIWWCLTVAFVLFYIAGANAKGLTISKLPTVGALSRPSYPILPKTRDSGDFISLQGAGTNNANGVIFVNGVLSVLAALDPLLDF
jgi:hypothetical protein